MSREIKFRAWDGKEMHHNVVIVDGVAYKRGYFANIFSKDAQAGKPMQYTGLKDKNGKEIYEGDIIQLNDLKAKVVYNSGMARFEIVPLTQIDRLMVQFYAIVDYAAVVGNIYEGVK